jgi:hypothetical protein
MFVSNSGSPASKLHVQIVYRSLTGIVGVLDGGYVAAGSAWQPSPVLLALELPLLGGAVQLKLTPVGTGGGWRVDDVYTDPWGSV